MNTLIKPFTVEPLKTTPGLNRALRRRFGAQRAVSMAQAVEAFEPIDALAQVLEEGMANLRTLDGRVDTRELAAFVLTRILGAQR